MFTSPSTAEVDVVHERPQSGSESPMTCTVHQGLGHGQRDCRERVTARSAPTYDSPLNLRVFGRNPSANCVSYARSRHCSEQTVETVMSNDE